MRKYMNRLRSRYSSYRQKRRNRSRKSKRREKIGIGSVVILGAVGYLLYKNWTAIKAKLKF